MSKIFFFFALAVCSASAIFVDEASNRITAGNLAAEGQFPYTISLQQLSFMPNQTLAHRCGGALITLQHALTAASCMYTIGNGTEPVLIIASQYRVYAGGALLTGDTVLERIRTIANFTVHPDYLAFPALLNDIAVITLTTPYLNTTVVPIPMATNNFIPTDFTLCTLAGWGAQSTAAVAASNELRFTTKYIYNQALCTTLYSSLPGTTNIHPSMTCAVSFDIISAGCNGDEGHALVCGGQLTGLLSLTNRCLTTSYPEIYTRVSNYTTWIRSVTGGASTFKPELGVFALVAVICAKMFS